MGLLGIGDLWRIVDLCQISERGYNWKIPKADRGPLTVRTMSVMHDTGRRISSSCWVDSTRRIFLVKINY